MPDTVQKLTATLDWWSSAPLGKPYLDYLHPEDWPDPWELIDGKDFDPATVSLGIYHTMRLSSDAYTANDLRLAVLRSHSLSHENLAVIAADHVANFTFVSMDRLIDLDDITIHHSYTYDAVRHCMCEIKSADF